MMHTPAKRRTQRLNGKKETDGVSSSNATDMYGIVHSLDVATIEHDDSLRRKPYQGPLKQRRRCRYWWQGVCLLAVFLILECSQATSIPSHVPIQQHSNPPSISSSSSNPSPPPPSSPKIGLNVAGRLKCFLWGKQRSHNNVPLTPLFSSREGEDVEELQGRIAPASVFAIADYHFQRGRWYGVQNIGALMQWNCRDNDGKPRFVPKAVDLVLEHALPPVTNKPTKAASLCLKWNDSDNEQPFLKFGISEKERVPEAALTVGCQLFQRLKLQWTSCFRGKVGDTFGFFNGNNHHHDSNLDSPPHDEDWWMPTVTLDPLGYLSSENQYTKWKDNKYNVDVKLKVRTRAPFLFGSSIDDNPQVTVVQLECSLMTNNPMKSPHKTVARLETAVIPSFQWWQSVRKTAQVALAHEQQHTILQKKW